MVHSSMDEVLKCCLTIEDCVRVLDDAVECVLSSTGGFLTIIEIALIRAFQ